MSEVNKILDEMLLDSEIKALQEKHNLSREFLLRNLPIIMWKNWTAMLVYETEKPIQ